jgi:ribosomal-protein-alanine N-acetyltransferase
MAEHPKVPIRTATASDIASMFQIERQASGASHWAMDDYQRIFDAESPIRFALIAGDDPLAGFLVARTLGPDWEIENLAIAPSARRLGVGRALVAELLQRARHAEAATVMLEVRESNQAARALYESSGFQAVARRIAYYHDPPEDAVIYRMVPGLTGKRAPFTNPGSGDGL